MPTDQGKKCFNANQGHPESSGNRAELIDSTLREKTPWVITAETSDLPEDYTQTELLVKPDKEAICEVLEQGQELPFAHLGKRGSSIRIK
ncbi:MAG: hypothetical protein HC924_13475 [Synechococcaceae cyanobacterium SM2_3_2]|nr:hypothetical protein [Synechococcaceae cyanobacterium SM2_3_2]